MSKLVFKLSVLLALLWLSSAVTLAVEPFTVKLRFDELDRATLRWPAVQGATEYCIRDGSNLVTTWERCVNTADIDYPLYAIFEGEVTPQSKFIVSANDKDGKPIVGGNATSEVGSNDVVVAKTEFGEFADLGDYAASIMRYALPLGIAAAIIMTIFAGIQFMLSQGQPDKIKDAQEIVQGAVLGLIVLIMARFLVNFLIVPPTDPPAVESATKNETAKQGVSS